jgi:5-methylcytosine-specific restriction endonuclease McrA
MKRTPLVRRTGLRRTRPLDAGAPVVRRRTGLSPMSAKTKVRQAERAEIRERVFARDGHRCRLDPAGYAESIGRLMAVGLIPEPRTGVPACHGALTPHHLLKASQGGAYTLDNLVTLCSMHNCWVEDHPAQARDLGLVIYSWEADRG